MTYWPMVVFWVVAVAGLYGPPPVLLYALLASMPFASLAVVPPELTGGLTLTPASVVAVLIVARCLGSRAGRHWFGIACTTPGPLAPLFVFWIVAVFTTVFAPTYFAGEVEVIPLRGEDLSRTELLAPSAQQISQLGYLTVSVFAVVACARLLQPARMRQHALRAMVLGAALLCLTGLLDWGAQSWELEAALEPLRTATYAIAVDAELSDIDMKRVAGVTPEPSAFGALCVIYLSTLWFFRRAMRDRWMRVVSPVLCLLLATMIWLSTSTTAYVGLAMLVVVALAEPLWRLWSSRRRSLERRVAWSQNRRLAALVLAIVAAFVVFPQASARVAEVVDSVVLAKPESQSFDERSMWTAVSLQSTFDTNGFGVGLGGTRASNSAVAMLSNVGVVGTLLYVWFLATTYLRRPARRAQDGSAWITAYRWSVPVVFAPGLISGTTADFGPYLALLFGSAVALQNGARTERLLQGADRKAMTLDRRRRSERRRAGRKRIGGYLVPRTSRVGSGAGVGGPAPAASSREKAANPPSSSGGEVGSEPSSRTAAFPTDPTFGLDIVLDDAGTADFATAVGGAVGEANQGGDRYEPLAVAPTSRSVAAFQIRSPRLLDIG